MVEIMHLKKLRYATNAYANTNVNTARPVDLVVMLYDGAIDYLNRTSYHMSQKDFSKKAEYISKAINIIGELAASLNMEEGKDIAKNLQDLYIYMLNTITSANIENNVEKINHVVGLLKNLRSAWQGIR